MIWNAWDEDYERLRMSVYVGLDGRSSTVRLLMRT